MRENDQDQQRRPQLESPASRLGTVPEYQAILGTAEAPANQQGTNRAGDYEDVATERLGDLCGADQDGRSMYETHGCSG
jgi:hypothetical protein